MARDYNGPAGDAWNAQQGAGPETVGRQGIEERAAARQDVDGLHIGRSS
ncbi:hypothetical protein [Micromonospora sp. KLBMP9576]